MLWVDLKFANLIGSTLEQFKIKSNHPYIASYRCFVCGDSKKRKRMTRGYLLEKDNEIISYCHNCGAYFSLGSLLLERSPTLYGEYRLECLREKGYRTKTSEPEIVFKPTEFKPRPLDLGPLLSESDSNDGLDYAKMRRIPEKFFNSLNFSMNVLNITKQIEKYKDLKLEPAAVLVIPFYNKAREYSHICCRAIDKDAFFRYYVFEVNTNQPSLWGLEFIDWTQPVYVFEGPIDAMCVPNSLAIGGSVGTASLDLIRDNINNTRDVCFVYDNEIFKNRQILKQVKLRIQQGFSVVIYDKNFNGKDANEVLINDRMTLDQLLSYYKMRTFAGLTATLELAHQSKTKFR